MAALSNCILSYGSPCVLVSLHYPFTVLLLVQNVHILSFFSSFNLFLILLLQYCYFLLFFCLALILALILPTYPSTTMNYYFFLPCLSSGRTWSAYSLFLGMSWSFSLLTILQHHSFHSLVMQKYRPATKTGGFFATFSTLFLICV